MNQMLMAGGAAVMWMLVPLVLLPFLYIYLLQDFHGRREGTRDPNLGAKILLGCLATLGAQLALVGLAFIAMAIAGDAGDGMKKTGLGLLVGGAVAGAFPLAVYVMRIPEEGAARIAHKAVGLNAMMAGLAFTVLATITSVAAFHEEDIAEPAAAAALYLIATVVLVMRLVKSPVPPAHSTDV